MGHLGRWIRGTAAVGTIGLGLGLCPTDAEAQPASEPDAETGKSPAVALFEQGLEDMLAGRYETGCPALEESFRLDPAPGALFTLAECEYKWGRFATAQTHYRDYLDRVERMAEDQKERQAQRVEVANEKLTEIEGKVPTLTIRLPEDAPEGATVKRDGQLLAPAMLGRPLPVDPGTYRLVVEAPDRKPYEQTVTLEPGSREEVELLLGAPTDSPLHPMQVGAIVAGSVGLAGLVGGTIAGAVAVGTKDTINAECVDQRCTGEGLDAVSEGQAAGTASTVLLVIGVAGAGAAVTLWLLAPDEEPDATQGSEQLSEQRLSERQGVHAVGLELAPRPGGGTVGLTMSF